ncbi:unnamed protein product [Kuraishia capsulata CBS 1993]|uniref:Amino acid permease/ SLC12A domain-containing protein n=1 Tax=Kuraishia capsulata CBS 1993 TaxID=1382522 RepID=W6MLU5_9ASCO|nr:uncharacterized protein KUCA_T00003090001 [Kuraishia capsulata CBS 1993]CDK27113.1 unnamed protein product [Kuraishia capsulata CBS 1993]
MLTSVKSVGASALRVDTIRSHQSDIREIDARHVTNDVDLLAEIGYKQELKRKFSTLQVFGVAYSIMGLLPSIASTTATGLTAGPAGFVWSWFVSGIFIVGIGIGMAELGSAIPTSGGLYYWTFHYAPEKIRVPLSYMIGLSNTLALCGGLCSVNYGFALEVLAAAYMNSDGTFVSTTGKTYGVFAACVVSHILVTCLTSNMISKMQTTSIICNSGIIVLFFIAVPIGTAKAKGFNDGEFIFGTVQNYSDWPTGWQFMLSMMTAIWTIGAFDSCVHMSEEAHNASKSIPVGIIGSTMVCWIVGFFICICMAACMSSDVASVIDSPTGFAMAQIVEDSLGKKWGVAMMVLIACCQWLMGSSLLTALSRQIWAFARDDGLPFSRYIKVVDKKLRVPLRAVAFGGALALTIGCLTLAGSTAANALFSLGVAGNYIAWGTPIFLRLTSGKDKFKPGPFYLGDTLSPIVNWIVCCWMIFVLFLCMFPGSKTVDKETMNYTVVINCGVWVLAMVYFYTYKFKYFHGPRSNLNDDAAEDIRYVEGYVDPKSSGEKASTPDVEKA